MKGETLSINGKLLQMDYCKLDLSNCKDSSNVFSMYVKKPHPDKLYRDEEIVLDYDDFVGYTINYINEEK